MKRFFALIIALAILALAAPALAEGKIAITATTYPLYSIAKAVAGDLADVTYDAEGKAASGILMCVGGSSAMGGVTVIDALNGIEAIEGDTDVLTVPVNVMICASYLADALSQLDADNNDAYQANLAALVDAMGELDLEFREAVAAGAAIGCDDGSMAYFAAEYGAEYVAGDGADVVLSTFDAPDEALLETPYADLMRTNLDKLTQTAE